MSVSARIVTAVVAVVLALTPTAAVAAPPTSAHHPDLLALVDAVDDLTRERTLPGGCRAPWAPPEGVAWDRQTPRTVGVRTWGPPAIGDVTFSWTLTLRPHDAPASTSTGSVDLVWRQTAPGTDWELVTDLCGDTEPAQVPAERFRDVVGTTHEAAILRLTDRGIIAGYPDGTFGPGAHITGRQASALVTRTWEDADPGPWTREPVATRGQIASLLAAAIRPPMVRPDPDSVRFVDVLASHPHARAVNTLADHGIIGGYADGTLRPDAPVTRGQMASLIVRALEHAG